MKQLFEQPLVTDGAFGTYYSLCVGETELCERANLAAPDTVLRVHRDYLCAGARAVRTNTFAANSVNFPEEEERYAILREGYRLALQAAEPFGARVFCSIGNIADKERASEDYLACVRQLASCGAKNFWFETLDSIEGLDRAIAFLRADVQDALIFISFAVSQDGFSALGESAAQLLAVAQECADAVGLNCRMGPAHMASVLRALPPLRVPLIALPNAGYPNRVGERTFFENNPAYFAEKCLQLRSFGASVLGGCCGTTPAHIQLLSENIGKSVSGTPAKKAQTPSGVAATAPVLRSAHKKYLAVELDPPVDADFSFFSEAAKAFCQHGADALTVSDSPFSKTRADSLMSALRLLQEGAPDVIPHITCRDKNHIALKGGLLAANAQGVDKVFIVTGDPPLKTHKTRRTGVYSFNSFEFLNYVRELSAEVFAAQPFLCGAALNVNAENFQAELLRAKKKLECGALFFMTQPVFSDAALENVILARKELPEETKLLAGILPVSGYKNALFLQNEVAGMGVSEALTQSLRGLPMEEQRRVSLAFCKERIDRLYDHCDGFFLMLPLRKTDYVCELMDYIRQKG